MATRASGRAHRQVDYNEKQAGPHGSVPAWTRQLDDGRKSAGPSHKENTKPQPAKQPARKSAPAVAGRGRDAGITRLPIEEVKGQAKPSSNKARSGKELVPAAAGKQVLPGVTVKAAPSKAGQAAAQPANKRAAEAKSAPQAVLEQANANGARSGSSGHHDASQGHESGQGGKRKAAAEAERDAAGAAKASSKGMSQTGMAAQPAAPANPPAGKRPKSAQALAAVAPATVAAGPSQQAQVAAFNEGAAAGGDHDVPLPGSNAEQLVEQYAANFQELQAEYAKLQALYEDLKAARIDEDVAALLEAQNRHVSEHGAAAAALADHYKAEAERQAAQVAELGGPALLESHSQLQEELLGCRRELAEREAEVVHKEARLGEMQARLAYLERYARVYESCDKCIQYDPPPQASAGAQFPSLQSSGVEMLQAHALVPEGAPGGSIYRRPKALPPAGAEPSYPQAAPTHAEQGVGTADEAAGAQAVLAAGAAGGAAGLVPVSGSDMQLTGGGDMEPQPPQQGSQQDEKPAPFGDARPTDPQRRHSLPPMSQQAQQQLQQQQRRLSLQPVAGRVAHAAAGPALRPGSAQSQALPAASGAAARQARRSSLPPPPATDRQLRFSSTSAEVVMPPLAAVPEEEEPRTAFKPAAHEPTTAAKPATAAALAELAGQHATATERSPAGAPSPSHLAVAEALVTAGKTPGSGPPPPRELALSVLTGLVVTPLRRGIYEFTEPRYGYVFQLGPGDPEPDSAELPKAHPGDDMLYYRPIALGGAEALLPDMLRMECSFRESSRTNFISVLLDALAVKHA